MLVRVLGSAAGGGVPQWNCRCAHCDAAREGRAPRRMQDSIAVSARAGSWVLLNVTTDIARQIDASPSLNPLALRQSPISAVLLTDANLDHSAGLLDLRQAAALRIYSTASVRATLTGGNAAFAPFAQAPRRWDCVDEDRRYEVLDAADRATGLFARAIDASGLTPSYAGARRERGAAVCFVLDDGRGAFLAYAPVFGEVTEEMERALRGASAVFLDGSFWSDDELPAAGLGARTARAMGHMPIAGDEGSLVLATRLPCERRIYTHVNNSNPILDPRSPAALALRAEGIEIAEDGLEFSIAAKPECAADARA